MAEIRPFSPAQEEEAEKYFKENHAELWSVTDEYHDMKVALYKVYFDLKVLDTELRPNQFILGVDYKSEADVLSGKEMVNLSFYNPHAANIADAFAKDFLIAKLQTLK